MSVRLPVSELCIFRAMAAVMHEVTKDDAPTEVVRWRIEQVVRLLNNVHYPTNEQDM